MRTLDEIEKDIAEAKRQLAEAQGTVCEVYSRIVGYYRAIKNWNAGRVAEYKMRKLFKIKDLTPRNE